jgi:hypothetical protein
VRAERPLLKHTKLESGQTLARLDLALCCHPSVNMVSSGSEEDSVKGSDDECGSSTSGCPEGEYEIESIVSHKSMYKRKRRNKRGKRVTNYLVSWKGYESEENCWVEEGDLGNASKLLDTYWAHVKKIKEEDDDVDKTLVSDSAPTKKGVDEDEEEEEEDDSTSEPDTGIKAILSHKMGKTRRDPLLYRVSWYGEDSDHTSWITEKEAKDDVQMFQEYWADLRPLEGVRGAKKELADDGTNSRATSADSETLHRTKSSTPEEGSKGTRDHSAPVQSPNRQKSRHKPAVSSRSKKKKLTKKQKVQEEQAQESSMPYPRPNTEAEWENVVKTIEGVYKLPDGKMVFSLVL